MSGWEVYHDWDNAPLDPEGYVFLPVHVMSIAEDIVSRSSAIHLARLEGRENLSPRDLDALYHVTEGLSSIAGRLGRAAFSGRLPMKCRAKSGGPLLPVESNWWGIDRVAKRVSLGAIDPENPYDPEGCTHWLFIHDEAAQWWADDVRIENAVAPIWERAINPDATPPNEFKAGAAPMSRSVGGRPPASWWPAFAEELAFYLHENGPPPGIGAQGSDQMIEAILTALSNRDIEAGRTTIQPVIRSLLARLRAK